jgi:hypothetical protein
MKKILSICMAVLLVSGLAACNKAGENTSDESEEARIPVETPSGDRWHEITGFPIEEELFIENLDVSVLETIAGEIQALVEEIGEKERADPDYVLKGRWNQDFRRSEQYRAVLGLGLKAVKPAYYIIYKSDRAGLYEYILASAVDEITGYDYSVTVNTRWSNSKEFLGMYNDKVKKTLKSFTETMEDPELIEAEKAKQICGLGIFAVAPLLNEMDKTSSALSADHLGKCLWRIVEDYTGEEAGKNLEKWRSENERTYRDIIETLEQ